MCADWDEMTKLLGARGFLGFCRGGFARWASQVVAGQRVGFGAQFSKHALERQYSVIECARRGTEAGITEEAANRARQNEAPFSFI